MFNPKFILSAFALIAFSATVSLAETTLQDGTVLSDEPTFIVTYVEVEVDAADKAAELIREQIVNSAAEDGNLRFEALQRINRDNHFVILEAWSGSEARAAHAAAPHTVAYREALEPMLYAPYDERPHVGLVAANVGDIPPGRGDTIYVITHADIIPPEQFAPCARQVDENGPCGNAMLEDLAEFSRTHEGNLRFDVLTQSNRANHMTVVEMWENAGSQAAHQANPQKKAFRNELAGIPASGGVNEDPQFVPNMLTGSLWDERLFKTMSN